MAFEDQIDRIKRVVAGIGSDAQSLTEVLRTCSTVPAQCFPSDFIDMLATKFGVPVEVIRRHFYYPNGHQHHGAGGDDFDLLVPPSGWLSEYIDYTLRTEPPTVFHFFAATTVLGATLGRRVYLPMGGWHIFPNVNSVLVAPAGVCKKTTACNMAVSLFRRVGGNVLADRITPEALIDSFKTSATATGLIYAPEWSVFLGKQQYMDGLVPMLTALFDCPAVWSSGTIMRGAVQLQNVALSHLAASTPDWIQTSITKEAFSGGFMSRLLFIVQYETSRKFAIPPPLDAAKAKRLMDGLLALQHLNGAMALTPSALAWYEDWYDKRRMKAVEKQLAGYFERKPDRLLQLSMVLSLSENPHSLAIEERTLERAEKILLWIERLLPRTFSELSSNTVGDDQHRLIKQLRHAGGTLTHSEWMRMNRSRMNADTFRRYVETLRQSGMIVLDVPSHTYYLLTAGWREEE